MHSTTLHHPESSRRGVVASIITAMLVILPFAGLVTAGILLWGWGFHRVELGLLLGMYLLSAVGITVGYHRLFAHRSFETPGPMRALFVILGCFAAEGGPLRWVATHRRHHQHSDREGDPHSPHRYGGGLLAILKGFVFAHVGWLWRNDPKDDARYVKDLAADPWVRRTGRLFGVWLLLGLFLPTVLGWWLIGGWQGAVLGFVWGGLARLFFVHHVTWSINSVCHLWGTQPYTDGDRSRNNTVFGVLALGEGWHNNHHAFPSSARHGLKWWQLDLSYVMIRAMSLVGLASNVKVAKPKRHSDRPLIGPVRLPIPGEHAR